MVVVAMGHKIIRRVLAKTEEDYRMHSNSIKMHNSNKLRWLQRLVVTSRDRLEGIASSGHHVLITRS